MNLKKTFYRKVVDPLLCPPHVVLKDGSDPLAKGKISQLMSQSSFLIPLLASTSFIAIDAYIFGGQNIKFPIPFFYASVIAPHMFKETGDGHPAYDEIKENKIKYYLDRTKKQEKPIDAKVYADLQTRYDRTNREIVLNIATQAILLLPAILAVNHIAPNTLETGLVGMAMPCHIETLANKWRMARALSGAWNVDKEPPKVKTKRSSKSLTPNPHPI